MGMVRTAIILALLAVGYTLLQRHLTPLPPPAQGSCKPKFKALENIFRDNFATGLDQGSAFAVYHKGELVCDLWGGWADKTNDLPWSQNTLTVTYSTTKGVSAIAFAVLYDRGLCDYNKLVSEYWPEFKQNGKDNVTIGMLLSHQAGLVAIDEDIPMEMLVEDPDQVGQIIAAQKPNWPPGTAHGYHALTIGILVDQLVRRIDPKHRSLQQFFREEIAEPYGIDFHIGLPRPLQWRAARNTEQSLMEALSQAVFDPPTGGMYANFLIYKKPLTLRAFGNPPLDMEHVNWPSHREMPQGSVNGYGTAHALARLYSLVVAAKYHDEPRLLSEETVRLLHVPRTSGIDQVIDYPTVFGYGVAVSELGKKKTKAIYHSGKGCQMAMGSAGLDMAWAYVTNYQSPYISPLVDARVKPIYEELIRIVES